MRGVLALSLLVTFISHLSRDEVDVLKKDGTIVSGYLESIEGDKISIRQYNGSSVTIRQSEITKMIFIDNVSGRKRWALKEFHILTNQDYSDITRLFILSQCDELSRMERKQLLSKFEENYSRFRASERPQIFGIGDFEDEYYLSIIANINTKVTKLNENVAFSGSLDIMCPVPRDVKSLAVSLRVKPDENAEFHYTIKEFIIYERRDLLNLDNNILGFEGARFTSPQELAPEPEWYNAIHTIGEWNHSESFIRSELPFASTGRITFCIISLTAVNCWIDDLSIIASDSDTVHKNKMLPGGGDILYGTPSGKGFNSDSGGVHQEKPHYVDDMEVIKVKYPSTGKIKVSYFTTNPESIELSISSQATDGKVANINKEVQQAQAMNRVERVQGDYYRELNDGLVQSDLQRQKGEYFMGEFPEIFGEYTELLNKEMSAGQGKGAGREEISQINDKKQELIDRFIEQIISEWYPINSYKINRVVDELTQQNERYIRKQQQTKKSRENYNNEPDQKQQKNFEQFRRDVINRLEDTSQTIYVKQQQIQSKERPTKKAFRDESRSSITLKPEVTKCACDDCVQGNGAGWFRCVLVIDLAQYNIDQNSYAYLKFGSTAKEKTLISDLVITVSG